MGLPAPVALHCDLCCLELLSALVLSQPSLNELCSFLGLYGNSMFVSFPPAELSAVLNTLLEKLICWTSFSSFFHFLIPFHISYLSFQIILWALQSCCLYLDLERGRQRQDVAFPCVCFSSPVLAVHGGNLCSTLWRCLSAWFYSQAHDSEAVKSVNVVCSA